MYSKEYRNWKRAESRLFRLHQYKQRPKSTAVKVAVVKRHNKDCKSNMWRIGSLEKKQKYDGKQTHICLDRTESRVGEGNVAAPQSHSPVHWLYICLSLYQHPSITERETAWKASVCDGLKVEATKTDLVYTTSNPLVHNWHWCQYITYPRNIWHASGSTPIQIAWPLHYNACLVTSVTPTPHAKGCRTLGAREHTFRRHNLDTWILAGARGSVAGSWAMLQAGRSRFRFPMSLDLSIDLNFLAALWPCGRLSL
jgi:hypothetical protein